MMRLGPTRQSRITPHFKTVELNHICGSPSLPCNLHDGRIWGLGYGHLWGRWQWGEVIVVPTTEAWGSPLSGTEECGFPFGFQGGASLKTCNPKETAN